MPVDPMRHAKGTTRALKLAAGENRLLKLSLPSGARAVKLFPFPKSLRVSIERGRHPAFFSNRLAGELAVWHSRA
jgi:hypothetical protein